MQLEVFRRDPDRLLNPTAAAVATEVYGSAGRWREVLEPLKEWAVGIAAGGATGPYEEDFG